MCFCLLLCLLRCAALCVCIDTDSLCNLPPPPHTQSHCQHTAELGVKASWNKERCDKVLAEMLREGLAMIDDQGPAPSGGSVGGAGAAVRLYWFPALSSQQQQQSSIS